MSRRKIIEAASELLVDRMIGILNREPVTVMDVAPADLHISDEECLSFDFPLMKMAPEEHKPSSPPAHVTCGTTAITIRVPNRVLQAFRAHSDRTGTRYQTLMNRALREAADTIDRGYV